MENLKTFLLNEALNDFEDDIDFITEHYIKKYYDNIMDRIEGFKNHKIVNPIEISFDSDVFKSKILKKVHEKNPITIKLKDNSFSHYAKNGIVVTVNSDFMRLMEENNSDLKYIYKNILHKELYESFENEMKIEKYVYSMVHELSHWVDDSLHSSILDRYDHFYDLINSKKRSYSSNAKLLSKKFRNMYGEASISPEEIEAQINVINHMKKRFSNEEWDNMSLKDVCAKNPSLNNVYENNQKTPAWRNKILARLYREGILGKNMR